MADELRARSLTGSRKSFAVAASPFNGVKLSLGMILATGMLLWFVAEGFAPWAQVLMLTAYGLAGMFWIVIKTREVLLRQMRQAERASNPDLEK